MEKGKRIAGMVVRVYQDLSGRRASKKADERVKARHVFPLDIKYSTNEFNIDVARRE
jgi:hypothetical protein